MTDLTTKLNVFKNMGALDTGFAADFGKSIKVVSYELVIQFIEELIEMDVQNKKEYNMVFIEAFQYWQNDKAIHPYTCINNGNHNLIAMVGENYSIKLLCPICFNKQTAFPEKLILDYYNNRANRTNCYICGLPYKLCSCKKGD